MDSVTKPPAISTLNESPLHASLKAWYARPTDRLEVPVDGYVVDVVRGDLLIEIQTQNFSAIRDKLSQLTARHAVRLVYPVAQEKWIVKRAKSAGAETRRRKSPKRGTVEQVFTELVSLPQLVARESFSLEVLLIQEEEVRRYVGQRAWRRRGWVVEERRLLDVVGGHRLRSPQDVAALLPAGLPDPFTTQDLARTMGQTRRLAQQMAYCLREMGAISQVGRRDRFILYARPPAIAEESETIQ
jgi:hypothetical protein